MITNIFFKTGYPFRGEFRHRIPLDSPWKATSLTSSMRMESTSGKCCDVEVIHDMSIKVAFGYHEQPWVDISPDNFLSNCWFQEKKYRIKARRHCHYKNVLLHFVEVEVEVKPKQKVHITFSHGKSWNFLQNGHFMIPQKSMVVAVHPQPFEMTSSPINFVGFIPSSSQQRCKKHPSPSHTSHTSHTPNKGGLIYHGKIEGWLFTQGQFGRWRSHLITQVVETQLT